MTRPVGITAGAREIAVPIDGERLDALLSALRRGAAAEVVELLDGWRPGRDLYREQRLPAGVVPVAPEDGRIIVTHSETGHHHVMTMERTKAYRLPDSIMDIFLAVEQGDTLEHLRPHDTHEPIAFGPGIYHVRRQREYVPEGFRRVED